jgi:hypothetical protein
MAGIAELVQVARAAGATFEISGPDIIVTGASAISPEVRDALRARRDEVIAYISGASDAAPSSLTLLHGVGVSISYLEDDETAGKILAEILSDAGDSPVGLDVETAARPDTQKTNEVLGDRR